MGLTLQVDLISGEGHRPLWGAIGFLRSIAIGLPLLAQVPGCRNAPWHRLVESVTFEIEEPR